ncbi:MAG: hypothetical protein SH820_08920 [Xanthomonadales bacterium]|nr:hypothetical protein [Xanthomonadales bacterium]
MLKVAIARQCERPSGYDRFIAFHSDYPGDPNDTADMQNAVQTVSRLVECH